ncbi:VOC family protein [Actinoplanes sp. NPDC051859]|uniref:VOC family protein n=1 Tax=Actinoplanes sp. NPDC051859 TaxID=3363909 RepID=UPI003792A223
MANHNGRPIAPARKLVAAMVGTIAVFVMVFGLGMSSWAIVALGVAMLALAIGIGMLNVVRRGARAWISGTAQVKAVSEPPATAVYGRAEILILILAPGLPAAEVTVRDPRVPVAKWPHPGDMLPVTVDVDDMRRVKIDWDEADHHQSAPPPAFYDEDLPDDDLLGGEPEPPPWTTRDRQWGRGPDEPPPPPAPGTTEQDDLPPPPLPGTPANDTPGAVILEGQLVDGDYPQPLPRRAATATAPPPSRTTVDPATAPMAPTESPATRDEAPAAAYSAPQSPGSREATATARSATTTAAPTRPADSRPRPRPRPRSASPDESIPATEHSSAPPKPARSDREAPAPHPAFPGPTTPPPTGSSASPESALPSPSQEFSHEAASARPPAARKSTDDDIDLSLDATTPAPTDDDLLGTLEPPPWQQRTAPTEPQTPSGNATHDSSETQSARIRPAAASPKVDSTSATAADPGPSTPATAEGGPASSGAAEGGPASSGSAEGGPASSGAAQHGPATPAAAERGPTSSAAAQPGHAAQAAAQPAPDASPTGPAPAGSTQATGLAAAVAAGVAALSSAFRSRTREEPPGPTPSATSSAPPPGTAPIPGQRPQPARPDHPGQRPQQSRPDRPESGQQPSGQPDVYPQPGQEGHAEPVSAPRAGEEPPSQRPVPHQDFRSVPGRGSSEPGSGSRTVRQPGLDEGFAPDDRTDEVITAYPGARPGPAGAIHGVGITVLVTDLARSIAFYREMLGFLEIDAGAGSAVLASGDTRLVLRTVPDLSAVAGRLIHLNLEVGDVEAVYEELQRKGVTFTHGPRPVNRGDKLELWAASFHDPDEHNIAITQWKSIR